MKKKKIYNVLALHAHNEENLTPDFVKHWKKTLLLCIFFGMLGAHHFYMNRPALGFGMFLFTLFGIIFLLLHLTYLGILLLLAAIVWNVLDLFLIFFSNLEKR